MVGLAGLLLVNSSLPSLWSPYSKGLRIRSDEQNGLPQGSKMAQMSLECRALEVWKNGSVSVIGSAICRSCVLSLVGQGLQHMQISVSQNQYKRSIVGRGIVVVLTAELCKPVH